MYPKSLKTRVTVAQMAKKCETLKVAHQKLLAGLPDHPTAIELRRVTDSAIRLKEYQDRYAQAVAAEKKRVQTAKSGSLNVIQQAENELALSAALKKAENEQVLFAALKEAEVQSANRMSIKINVPAKPMADKENVPVQAKKPDPIYQSIADIYKKNPKPVVDPLEELRLFVGDFDEKEAPAAPGETNLAYVQRQLNQRLEAWRTNAEMPTINVKYVETHTTLPQAALRRSNDHRATRELNVYEFFEDSYNGVRTEHFQERLDSLYAAAKAMVNEQNIDTVIKEVRLENMEDLYELASGYLRNNRIGPNDARDVIIPKMKQALYVVQQFSAHLVAIQKSLDAKQKIPHTDFEALLQKEAQLVAKKPKADFVHMYRAEGKTRVSSAHAFDGYSLPSTVRDEKKLANLWSTTTGRLDAKGQYQVEFELFRHSSYPPISIKGRNDQDTKMQRLDGAYQAAKQMLGLLAQQKYNADSDPFSKGPVRIPLTTMMLLSPSWLLDSGYKSEGRQVEESHRALQMLHGQTITIEITDAKGNKKPVAVQLDSTCMNAPVNGKASRWLYTDKPTINNVGFHKHLMATDKHIDKLLAALPKGNRDLQQIADEYRRLRGNPESLQTNMIKGFQELLQKSHKKLARYLEIYQIAPTPENLKNFQQEEKEIKQLEKSLEREVSKVLAERKASMQKNNGKAVDQFQQHLSKVLDTYDLPDDARAHLMQLQLAVDCESLYQRKQHISFDHAHDFQARVALLHHAMGENVESFCKSGEDRTGRFNNYVEELFAFRDAHGRFPRPTDEDYAKMGKTARAVQQFSVSRRIAGANAPGAYGLQQDFDYKRLRLNNEIDTQMDRMVAKSAKESILSISQHARDAAFLVDLHLAARSRHPLVIPVLPEFASIRASDSVAPQPAHPASIHNEDSFEIAIESPYGVIPTFNDDEPLVGAGYRPTIDKQAAHDAGYATIPFEVRANSHQRPAMSNQSSRPQLLNVDSELSLTQVQRRRVDTAPIVATEVVLDVELNHIQER